MKKSLLNVALALVLGVGTANADEINATLVHTASTTGNANNATITVTVDAEKEAHNQENQKSWDGYAFAEFSFELPVGHTITSASLKWTVYGNSSKGRSSKVYVLNAGKTIDYEEIQPTPQLLPFMGEKSAVSGDMSVPSKKDVSYTTDVTAAVQEVAASQNYVIFQWTNNAQGGELYGKASDKAPVLVITTADASLTTSYTVKFVDTDGAILKAAAVHDGVTIGDEVTASAAETAAFVVDGQKYIYASGNDGITLVKEETDNVITLVFRKAETWTAVLTNNLNGNTITKSGWEGDAIEVGYPLYVNVDGTLYSTGKHSNDGKGYYVNMVLSGDNVTREIAYTESEITDIVALVEVENVEGAKRSTNANTGVRSSNGGSAYASGSDLVITTLAPGKYIMKAVVCDASKNPETSFKFNAGDVTVLTTKVGAVNWAESTSAEFEVNVDTEITLLAGAGGANVGVDFVYVQKTGEAVDKNELAEGIKAATAKLNDMKAEPDETRSDDAIQDLSDAIANAKEVLDDETADQTTVNEAVLALEKAQNTATGINTVNVAAGNAVRYNLAGQRTNANGIVISNGKKFVVK